MELLDERGVARRCHLHDPGRLSHLLAPGSTLIYRDAWRPGRATSCDVVAVLEPHSGALVLEDTRLANQLFPLVAGEVVPGLRGEALRAEVQANGSRIDFAGFDEASRPVLVEVKSTNLAAGGVALFPDSPSRRASRQLEVLAAATRSGARAAVVFTVLRGDAERVRPNRSVDPLFSRLLCSLRVVEAYAYRLRARLEEDRLEIYYAGTLPVERC